jgi:hypothetical protein
VTVRPPLRRSRRRKRVVRVLLLLVGAVIVFAFGVALGQALREQPDPGRRTELRTLRPATVAPPPRTVTVTVTDEG